MQQRNSRDMLSISRHAVPCPVVHSSIYWKTRQIATEQHCYSNTVPSRHCVIRALCRYHTIYCYTMPFEIQPLQNNVSDMIMDEVPSCIVVSSVNYDATTTGGDAQSCKGNQCSHVSSAYLELPVVMCSWL